MTPPPAAEPRNADAADLEVTLTRQRRRARLFLAAILSVCAAPIGIQRVATLLNDGVTPPWANGLAISSMVICLFVILAIFVTDARPGVRVLVAPHGLTFARGDQTWHTAMTQIESALVVHGHGRDCLELRLRDGETLELQFPVGVSAAAILHSLDATLDVARRTVKLRLYSASRDLWMKVGGAGLGGVIGAIVGLIVGVNLGKVSPTLGALAGLATIIPFARWGMQINARFLPDVTVGSDGLSRRGYQTTATAFVPLGEIEGTRVELNTSSGRRGRRFVELKLVVKDGSNPCLGDFAEEERELAEAFGERIMHAVSVRSNAPADGANLGQLERGGADMRAWVASLGRVKVGADDYRGGGVSIDRLRQLLDGGTTTAEHRLAAALLLAKKGDAADRQRIRIAADAVVSPGLRIALTSIADGESDEESLDQALREATLD